DAHGALVGPGGDAQQPRQRAQEEPAAVRVREVAHDGSPSRPLSGLSAPMIDPAAEWAPGYRAGAKKRPGRKTILPTRPERTDRGTHVFQNRSGPGTHWQGITSIGEGMKAGMQTGEGSKLGVSMACEPSVLEQQPLRPAKLNPWLRARMALPS